MKASDLNTSFSSQQTDNSGRSRTSQSSASSRYGLDEEDNSPVVVYEYRGGVELSTQKELAERVNKDPSKRVTRKSIPRGTSLIDLYGSDLCLPQEKDELKHNAAYWVNLASVPLPRTAFWQRLIFGGYDELYIVSPESSPENSQCDPDSRKPTPASTWGSESDRPDAQLGAQA